jgi:DNA-binding response OmpR family regulator
MTDRHRPEERAPSVLVVDDERDVADLYSTWLERECSVQTAYGPDGALEKVDETTDVVFLDRQMPAMTGDEVLEQIRSREVGCHVVMVTAVDPDFDIVDMPFDDYLTKPVMMTDLRDAVTEMLTRESYDRQLQEYFALASKKATLEAQKDPIELQGSDTYNRLESEVKTIAEETNQLASEMNHRDFESMFGELSNN